ncbi:LLM class flavin-dependent oxidoreductase [Kribbella sp. VKM Ac-2566]|uniref:LLM class flavin-dependent oxidoreductase n=1 Tax=Kribbella sp. VKM Ac-2566 TaxID=2512218 RepID=UPI0010E92D99|nr:LLM class flavin-dependent oxidoreductase [Kribbella sp. VKM Ac-2566]TDW91577.1 alkanesulfonate monooxygenase SsuD/methylene tetrahydromethanopterin reductase-like flavin-dependent oxidoreductase (luciferase family) [Kribbella sp. VKM Ac-2566]
MRVGIGLPAAVPGVDARRLGGWAAAAEEAGFDAVGVIDRLVYDNLEPLTALAAAAARTSRVELVTTVLNIGWRNNAVLLAKQLASVDQLSGGRLTAGVGLGGWPDDFIASGAAQHGFGELWTTSLETWRQVWAGKLEGMSNLPDGRPGLLFGGLVPAAYRRAAVHGQGWVAPLFGTATLEQGASAVRTAWKDAGRSGDPRIVTGRYFALGPEADAVADEYIRHYYGDAYFEFARADTLTTPAALRDHLTGLRAAGATDVIFYPASPDHDQVSLLAEALAVSRSGVW